MAEQVKTQIREIKRQRVKGERVMEKSVTRRLTRLNRIEISFPSIVEVNVRREILQPASAKCEPGKVHWSFKTIAPGAKLQRNSSCYFIDNSWLCFTLSAYFRVAILLLSPPPLLFSFFLQNIAYPCQRLLNKSARVSVAFLLKNGLRRNGNKMVYFKISEEKMSKWSKINMT